jgi:hypothetical protein
MNLKELAGRVREAVKTPDSAEPVTPPAEEKPFAWETPQVDLEVARAQATAAAPRVETRPAATKEALRDGAPKADARRPEVGRGPDLRGAESVEAAGRAVRWKAPATVPDLATIYKEAGIESPLHGYGVDKLTEMLSSPHLASAPREVRATAAQVALEAARVPLRDIIDDALLRAKALAAFEADKAFELQLLQMRAERRAQVLRDQVDAFRKQKNAEIEELKRTIDASDQAFAQLRARKRREEERLHRIVTHFVEPRPAVSAQPAVAPRPGAQPVAAPAGPPAGAPPTALMPAAASEPARPAAAPARPADTQPVAAAARENSAAPPVTPVKPMAPIGPVTERTGASADKSALAVDKPAAGPSAEPAAAAAGPKPARQEER